MLIGIKDLAISVRLPDDAMKRPESVTIHPKVSNIDKPKSLESKSNRFILTVQSWRQKSKEWSGPTKITDLIEARQNCDANMFADGQAVSGWKSTKYVS